MYCLFTRNVRILGLRGSQLFSCIHLDTLPYLTFENVQIYNRYDSAVKEKKKIRRKNSVQISLFDKLFTGNLTILGKCP